MSRLYIYFLALFLPAVLVFKAVFLPSTLVSGDAPYLFITGMREFLGNAQTWNEWGNVLGGINAALWLYPINFLYGLVGAIPIFGNDFAIRLIFVLPAILLSFAGSIVFARFLKLSNTVTLFTALLYTLNTYFLLLLDGGQVGVALAYGIFPLTLLWVKKLIDKPSANNFFLALLIFNIHIHTDIRIAAMALLTSLVWKTFELIGSKQKPSTKSALGGVLLVGASLFLNAYWLYPLLSLGSLELNTAVSNLQLTSLLNSLTLFQPHWPGNEFGVVSPPPWFFLLLPIIWIIGQVVSPNKKTLPLVLTLLTFGFLAKGTTPPLGFLYEEFLTKVPFASFFRDSTKFFPPLILLTGILVGESVKHFSKYRNKLVSKTMPVLIYTYLLLLISPALFGQLNGALSSIPLEKDYQIVADNVSSESGEFRTAWFPLKPPFAYYTNKQPALDARYLVNKRPIASLNVGTFDSFNFLNSPLADEWLELFNIKYLFFNRSEKAQSDKKQEEWNSLISRIEENKEIKKVDWGTNLKAYELTNTKPRVFETEKAVVVVGSENVYEKLFEKNPEYDIANNVYFFAEDGLFAPQFLQGVNPSQVELLLNDKTKLDLQMSFLQSFLWSANDTAESAWAKRNSQDYLRWKYEFLVNGVETKEFDYAKGVSFSTVPGEKIKMNIPTDAGENMLVVRALDKPDTQVLKLSLNGTQLNYKESKNAFGWNVFPVVANKLNEIEIENPGGFHAINVVGLVPKLYWDASEKLAEKYLNTYKVTTIDELAASGRKWEKVDFRASTPALVSAKQAKSGWLVSSSTYDFNWPESLPAYSSINSWYVPETSDITIEYKGQKLLRDGLKVSFVTLVLLSTGFFGLKFRKRK